MHELTSAHGINGKGDAERSTKWREYRDEINWPNDSTGFVRVSHNRIRKTYGARPSPGINVDFAPINPPSDSILAAVLPSVPEAGPCCPGACGQCACGGN